LQNNIEALPQTFGLLVGHYDSRPRKFTAPMEEKRPKFVLKIGRKTTTQEANFISRAVPVSVPVGNKKTATRSGATGYG
jgi:hypothetical protein